MTPNLRGDYKEPSAMGNLTFQCVLRLRQYLDKYTVMASTRYKKDLFRAVTCKVDMFTRQALKAKS